MQVVASNVLQTVSILRDGIWKVRDNNMLVHTPTTPPLSPRWGIAYISSFALVVELFSVRTDKSSYSGRNPVYSVNCLDREA